MNRIKELRTAAGLTLRSMCQEMESQGLSISWMAISKAEKPDSNPAWRTVDLIATYFKVSTDYLMCRDNKLGSAPANITNDKEEDTLPPELRMAVERYLKKQMEKSAL